MIKKQLISKGAAQSTIKYGKVAIKLVIFSSLSFKPNTENTIYIILPFQIEYITELKRQ